VRSEAGFIEATARVLATHPLASGGRAPCFLGLEVGAQAAAALEALLRGTETGDGSPRVGYLVSVREATFLQPDLPVDASLVVTAHLEGAAPPLAIYRIRITVDDVEFLHATLSTYGGASVDGHASP
jgi:predicted hotdog family 3-hydroxylacyl-ACP dehydratase